MHVEVDVDQLLRHVADDDHPRFGRLLDPGGEVRDDADDRVAFRHTAIVAQVADHHLPGVDADADLRGHADPTLEVGARVAHRDDQVQPGEDGPTGVVLVGIGVPEGGKDAVTGELDEVAAVPGHGVAGCPR